MPSFTHNDKNNKKRVLADDVPQQKQSKTEAPTPTPSEDAQKNSDLIDFSKYENIPIKVTGSGDIPSPINSFAEMKLEDFLLENIQINGYTSPTPVQKHALPIISAGRDVMATAQTGSGKTAAFLFPFINKMVNQLPPAFTATNRIGRGYVAHPTALVLAPTRELAIQIHTEAVKFIKRSKIRAVVIYGGAPYRQQAEQIERGCDLLIATPGRLQDMMENRKISMDSIKYLCLDEADRMLDMGFEPQIRAIIEQADMPPKDTRQTVLFSATFPKPIQNLASDFLRDYLFLEIGRVGATADKIKQIVKQVEEHNKRNTLLEDLKDVNGLSLVFVETKRGADILYQFLNSNGILAESIHGDRTQFERERALRTFKTGRVRVLVATSVAARGLDIPNVELVINFDLPNQIDDYVHRIGRTGRAGRTGVAIAYYNDENRGIAKDLYKALKDGKAEIPDFLEAFSRERSQKNNGRYGYGGSRGGRGGRGGFGGSYGSGNRFGRGGSAGGFGNRQQRWGSSNNNSNGNSWGSWGKSRDFYS